MSFVTVAEPRQGLAIGKFQPSLRSLQGLNLGFLIHTDDHGVLRWVEVKSHNVRRLAGKLGIGADAPTPAAFKTDGLAPQDAPDLVLGNVTQGFGQKPAV